MFALLFPSIAVAASPTLAQRHIEIGSRLPASVSTVVSFDARGALTWAIDDTFGLLPATTASTALRETLATLSKQRLGVDLFQARTVTFWADSWRSGIYIDGPFSGTLTGKLRAHEDQAFVEVWGDWVAFQDERGIWACRWNHVPSLLEAARGGGPTLGASFFDSAAATAPGTVLATVNLREARNLGVVGLESASVSVGDAPRHSMAFAGTTSAVAGARKLIERHRKEAQGIVRKFRDRAAVDEPVLQIVLELLAQKLPDVLATVTARVDRGLLIMASESATATVTLLLGFFEAPGPLSLCERAMRNLSKVMSSDPTVPEEARNLLQVTLSDSSAGMLRLCEMAPQLETQCVVTAKTMKEISACAEGAEESPARRPTPKPKPKRKAGRQLEVGELVSIAAKVVALDIAFPNLTRSATSLGLSGMKAKHLQALADAPENALWVASLDLGGILSAIVDRNANAWPVKVKPTAVRKAVGAIMSSVWGVDVLAARHAHVFITTEGADFGLAVDVDGTVGKALRGDEVEVRHGTPIVRIVGDVVAALTKRGLVVGNVAGVRGRVDFVAGRVEALSHREERVRAHREALELVDDAPLIASGRLQGLGLPFELQGAALSAFGASLVKLGATAETDAQPPWPPIEAAVESLTRFIPSEGDHIPPLGHVVMAYLSSKADVLRDTFRIAASDGRLTGSIDVLAGVLAFRASDVADDLKVFFNEALSDEAMLNLERIYKAVTSAFIPTVDGLPTDPQACRFPESTDMTPPASCCDPASDKDGDRLCDGDSTSWDHPTWQALNFAPSGPHRFRYQFVSNGKTGDEAKFTVTAIGDLDCDGVFSTFERYGYAEGSPDGTCSMRGSRAHFRENPGE